MWIFRILFPILALYILYLYIFRLSVGMLPVWIVLFGLSLLLSFESIYSKVFQVALFKNLFIVGVILFIVIEITILYAGIKTSIDEDCDYIIVLGASVRGETMSLTLHRRAEKAYEYLSIHDDAKAVLSGGMGPGEDISEAEAMRRYIVKKGIDVSRLILEDKSTNTKENIEFSYKFIEKDAEVIVISSSFHVLRSQMVAKKQGKSVKGIGSNTFIYLAPNYYLREFFGLFYEIFR